MNLSQLYLRIFQWSADKIFPHQMPLHKDGIFVGVICMRVYREDIKDGMDELIKNMNSVSK